VRDLYPSGAGLEAAEGYLRALQWHGSLPRTKPKIFVDHSKSSMPSAHVDSGLKSQTEPTQSSLKSLSCQIKHFLQSLERMAYSGSAKGHTLQNQDTQDHRGFLHMTLCVGAGPRGVRANICEPEAARHLP